MRNRDSEKKAKIGPSNLLSSGAGIGDDDGGAEEELVREDPLLVFGSEIVMLILSKLDARSAALCRLVSRGWLPLASSDIIWAPKEYFIEPSFIPAERQCEELWLGKAHIPRISKGHGLAKLASYSLSVMDGKRARITRDDLCDHTWEYHFNEGAPNFWRNLDPHWQGTGGTPMHRYFHPDGSVTADPGDNIWGGHESCYTIVTGLFADGKIREHYVRINRWPQMSVKRKPDWGWELSNHLYCYTSVPDADKDDGTGPLFPLF